MPSFSSQQNLWISSTGQLKVNSVRTKSVKNNLENMVFCGNIFWWFGGNLIETSFSFNPSILMILCVIYWHDKKKKTLVLSILIDGLQCVYAEIKVKKLVYCLMIYYTGFSVEKFFEVDAQALDITKDSRFSNFKLCWPLATFDLGSKHSIHGSHMPNTFLEISCLQGFQDLT